MSGSFLLLVCERIDVFIDSTDNDEDVESVPRFRSNKTPLER